MDFETRLFKHTSVCAFHIVLSFTQLSPKYDSTQEKTANSFFMDFLLKRSSGYRTEGPSLHKAGAGDERE